MHMQTIDLSLFQALTEVGVKPETARNVEKKVETAIFSGQNAIRTELRAEMLEQLMSRADGSRMEAKLEAQLMSKADGLRLETKMAEVEVRMHKSLNEITWKMVAFMVAANSLMLTVFKLLG